MKRFVVALTALTLAAGAASAAGMGNMNERPGAPAQVEAAANTMQVPAGDVLTAVELERAGLNANDKLTVTSFPTSEWAMSHPER